MSESRELLERKSAVYQMGLLFNQPPGDERITAYAKALEAFSKAQIVYAFNKVIKSGTPFFPSLAEILKHLSPVEQNVENRAIEIANEIVSMAQAYGYMQTDKAFERLSEDAKDTIKSPSMILEICNTQLEQLSTIKAQLRRLAIASLQKEKNDGHNQIIESLGINFASINKSNEYLN